MPASTTRPIVMGRRGVVTSGHYLATAAGFRILELGMTIQKAIDAPTVHSEHFPSSFYPREAHPGRVVVEGRVSREVIAALERRGHEVVVTDDWVNGKVMGIRYDSARGVILSGVSPRGQIGYALGW